MKAIIKILKRPYHGLINSGKKIRNLALPTARILLYHRIAESKNDPHLLCVSPENFRAQIKFLKENYKIIPLIKLTRDIRKGKVENNSVVITFDDGYADNLYNALPILQELEIPATIFLTAGYIGPEGQNKPFYWDENTAPEDRGKPMSPDEAKRLSNSPLIEIGAHTLTHPKLANLDENRQFQEIIGSKKMLEKILDIPLLGFAYPFGSKGSFTSKTIELVKKAGFHYACANIHERVTEYSDIYALPRFIPRNWNLEEFKKNLEKFI